MRNKKIRLLLISPKSFKNIQLFLETCYPGSHPGNVISRINTLKLIKQYLLGEHISLEFKTLMDTYGISNSNLEKVIFDDMTKGYNSNPSVFYKGEITEIRDIPEFLKITS